jgi:hypothetical protein
MSHTSILDRIRQLFVNLPSAEAPPKRFPKKTRRAPNSRIEDCQEGDFDCETFVDISAEMIAQFLKRTDAL